MPPVDHGMKERWMCALHGLGVRMLYTSSEYANRVTWLFLDMIMEAGHIRRARLSPLSPRPHGPNPFL